MNRLYASAAAGPGPTSTIGSVAVDAAVYQMNSAYLARFYIPQRDLVELHGNADRRPLAAFYTNNMCDVSQVRAGVLLRNWAEIPGRDLSPERSESSELPALSLSPESPESQQSSDQGTCTCPMQSILHGLNICHIVECGPVILTLI